MDSVTHIVLGACIGEVIAGKQLGKKALLIGAIAQSLPDIDFVASFWLSTSADLLAHRGFTHSFTFIILIAPILGYLSGKAFPRAGMTTRKWIFFWGLQIFIHQFIDAFNAYGTGWFEPFSHYRVSFNTMFVADPLFTVWPTVAFCALLILRRTTQKRKKWAGWALILCSIYLVAGVVLKLMANKKIDEAISNRQIAATDYFTTPTPLNNLLWYLVARNDTGYSIGYWSVFDKTGRVINFHHVGKNDSLLSPAGERETVNDLVRFSQGYYAAQMWHDTLVFNDLRFGEILGWAEPKPQFVFYYYLNKGYDNDLLVQRGRFARWDKQNIRTFIKRIGGN